MKYSMIKSFSFLLIIAMLVSVPGFSVTYPDTEGHKYYEAIETLTALKIVQGNNGEFRPDDFMTRAEFVRLALNAMNLEEEGAEKSETRFIDVPINHWASGAIKLATDMGIINGTSETTFEPDESIKYEQAVKIIVCSLGYDKTITGKPDYPNSYLALADKMELTKNLNVQVNENITRGEVCELLYRAIDTPLMEEHTPEATTGHIAQPSVTPLATIIPEATQQPTNTETTEAVDAQMINVDSQLVFDSYREVIDSNGDKKDKIFFWFEDALYSAICRDVVVSTGFDLAENKGTTISISALKRGDVISISQNIRYEVTDIARYAPPNDKHAVKNNDVIYLIGARDRNEKVFAPLLGDIRNNRISVGTKGDGAKTYDYRITDAAFIYQYESANNRLKPIDKSDIYVNDDKTTYAYVSAKDGVPKVVVVYHY